ncbi:hypothetical protein P5V15_015024 [Pogonomyrmex californicus]
MSTLNPREFNQAPTATLTIKGLMPNVKFMIDTGAAPNLIKERNILSHTSIFKDNILYLSGITQGKIATRVYATRLLGYKIKMHAVPNNFPIVQEGILESDFLCDNATIDFPRKLLLWQEIPFNTTRSSFQLDRELPSISTSKILKSKRDIYRD